MRVPRCVVVIIGLGLLGVTCGKQRERQPGAGGGVPGKVEAGVKGRIAFMSTRDRNYEIYVMDADGTNQTRLTNNEACDYNPSWSPDGSKIAFTSNRDGNYEAYVMNADGSNQTNLTNNPAWDQWPSWSPF